MSAHPSSFIETSRFYNYFYYAALAIFALAIVFLIAFGFAGFGRGDVYAKDFAYFYSAGQVWLNGQIPYIYDTFRDTALRSTGLDPATNFAYLPTISLFASSVSLLTLGLSKLVMGLINIFAIISLCWVSITIAFRHNSVQWNSVQVLLLCALIIGNPFTAHVAWMGQTSLIVTAAICLAFIWSGQGRYILAGIMLSIASIKPQLTLLIGLWLLFEKQYKVIGVAIIVSIVFSLPALVTSGIALPLDWLAALKGYQGGVHDVVTFRHVFGLRSFLSNFGIVTPTLLPIALACFGILFWKRKAFHRLDILPLLIMTSLIFIYAHDYDVAAFFITCGSLWWYLKDKMWEGILALTMLAYICIPQRLVLHYFPDAGHYREPIFFILCGWLLWMMIKKQPEKTLTETQALPN